MRTRCVREQIDRFRKEVIGKDDLWQSIRLQQQFEPTWVEKSAGGAEAALNSPLANVLMHAMVEAAGAAMSGAARRSVQRRSQMGRGGTGRRIDMPMPRFEPAPPAATITRLPDSSRPRLHQRRGILSIAGKNSEPGVILWYDVCVHSVLGAFCAALCLASVRLCQWILKNGIPSKRR